MGFSDVALIGFKVEVLLFNQTVDKEAKYFWMKDKKIEHNITGGLNDNMLGMRRSGCCSVAHCKHNLAGCEMLREHEVEKEIPPKSSLPYSFAPLSLSFL